MELSRRSFKLVRYAARTSILVIPSVPLPKRSVKQASCSSGRVNVWPSVAAVISTLEIVTNDRQRTTRAMKLTNAFFYTEFTQDTLRRVRDGRPPIADLADDAAAVTLIEAAYAMSPLGG
jgi:hypothetical protein